MSDVERLCAKAILQAMALGKELENDLDGHVKVSAITCPYCETISQTYELAKVHDGECTKHPMARRVAALEAELASARNLYAAQEERYERGQKAEDAARARADALDLQVVQLTADRERLDWLDQWAPLKDECYELIRFWRSCGKRHPEGLRAAIDAARKAAE